jgi:CRISPR-associated protein Cas1
MLSFVYDVADLYKVDLLVPLVFKVVSISVSDVERRVRSACRVQLHEQKLLERMLPDIREVLDGGHDSGGGPAQPAGGSESLDAGTEGRDIPRPHDRPYP